MTDYADILNAMQFSYFATNAPLNTTGEPRQTITYQYAGTSRPSDLPTGTSYSGWTSFTSAEKAAYEAALAHIETFLNVDFVEVTGSSDADLNVGKVALSGSVIGQGGYGIKWSSVTGIEWDGFTVFDNAINLASPTHMSTMLHEIAHAMGLKHPFSGTYTLPSGENSHKYTVMAYASNPDNGMRSDAMMLYDVYALQDIWGAVGYKSGNTVYTGPRTNTVDAIWDTGGTDMLDANGRAGDVVLDLREGRFSTFDDTDDVVITYGTVIEKARGGLGDDVITGNAGKNTLLGGGGMDSIEAGNKADKVKGGGGSDVLDGQNGNDKIFGNGGNDILLGGAGRDKLNGQAGNDTLTGGTGADRFVFASGGGRDTITDFEDGVDSIQFSGLGSAAGILGLAAEAGGHVVFDFGGGDELTVWNATIAELSDQVLI